MPEQPIVDAEVVAVEEEVIEQVRNLPAVRASEAMVARDEISADDVVAQREKITQVMQLVMKPEVHYGKVPGVSKPTLLKPGAELLAVTFRLAPSYDSERTFHDNGHLTVVSKCLLTHIPTGLRVAEGEGLCTSMEKKYAWRNQDKVCPVCSEGDVRKSKFPPRETDYPGARPGDPPGWYCTNKSCKTNFAATDERIVSQEGGGKVANPDLADTFNTVLKMSNKRALVAAILNGTGASDVFTQDVEDLGSSADLDQRGNERSAIPPKRKKVIDIEELFAIADKKRGVAPGTTINEARKVKDVPLVEMTEADLDDLGPKIGAFAHTLTAEQMNARGFGAYYEDIPFG